MLIGHATTRMSTCGVVRISLDNHTSESVQRVRAAARTSRCTLTRARARTAHSSSEQHRDQHFCNQQRCARVVARLTRAHAYTRVNCKRSTRSRHHRGAHIDAREREKYLCHHPFALRVTKISGGTKKNPLRPPRGPNCSFPERDRVREMDAPRHAEHALEIRQTQVEVRLIETAIDLEHLPRHIGRGG
jgi:hypothetical protein